MCEVPFQLAQTTKGCQDFVCRHAGLLWQFSSPLTFVKSAQLNVPHRDEASTTHHMLVKVTQTSHTLNRCQITEFLSFKRKRNGRDSVCQSWSLHTYWWCLITQAFSSLSLCRTSWQELYLDHIKDCCLPVCSPPWAPPCATSCPRPSESATLWTSSLIRSPCCRGR